MNRHYELFAEAVMPQFQHRIDRLAQTEQHARDRYDALYSRMGDALEEAQTRHAAEKAAQPT
jgi:limonene 1,2-monooxygenase